MLRRNLMSVVAVVVLAVSVGTNSAQALEFLAPATASGLLSNFDMAVFTGAPVSEPEDNWINCGLGVNSADLMVLNKGQQPVHLRIGFFGDPPQPGTRLSNVQLVAHRLCSVDGVLYDLYVAVEDSESTAYGIQVLIPSGTSAILDFDKGVATGKPVEQFNACGFASVSDVI